MSPWKTLAMTFDRIYLTSFCKMLFIVVKFLLQNGSLAISFKSHYCIASSPPEKRGVGDFGSRDIGGGLALISGFWGDLRKRGE